MRPLLLPLWRPCARCWRGCVAAPRFLTAKSSAVSNSPTSPLPPSRTTPKPHNPASTQSHNPPFSQAVKQLTELNGFTGLTWLKGGLEATRKGDVPAAREGADPRLGSVGGVVGSFGCVVLLCCGVVSCVVLCAVLVLWAWRCVPSHLDSPLRADCGPASDGSLSAPHAAATAAPTHEPDARRVSRCPAWCARSTHAASRRCS